MKCRALLACDKIIVDKQGAHSLINVMAHAIVWAQQQLPGQEPQDIPIPPNAVSPQQWWIYTFWTMSPAEDGQSFEQVYQVYWPNGEKLMENRLPFKQQGDKPQQTTYFIGGFPVGQEGAVKIVTWLDSHGTRVSDIEETVVFVSHKNPALASATPVSLSV